MKKIVACLAVLALGVALIPPADAGCRRVVQAQAVVVHQDQAVIVQPAVVTTAFLSVPVPVYPVYGVGYGAGDTAAELRALTAELGRLRQQLAPAAAAPAPPAVQPPPPPAFMPRDEAKVSPDVTPFAEAPKLLASITTACARCHGAKAPKGGLTLVAADGTLAPLALVDRLRVFRSVATGKMPKGGAPVDDAALDLFARWSE